MFPTRNMLFFSLLLPILFVDTTRRKFLDARMEENIMSGEKGFTLIEILVASVILTMAISIATISYREYVLSLNTQRKYENIYVSVLTLANKMEEKKLNGIGFFTEKGKINGINYVIKARRVAAKRNYRINVDDARRIGVFYIYLYRIEIKIDEKIFVLYKTSFRKIG